MKTIELNEAWSLSTVLNKVNYHTEFQGLFIYHVLQLYKWFVLFAIKTQRRFSTHGR